MNDLRHMDQMTLSDTKLYHLIDIGPDELLRGRNA